MGITPATRPQYDRQKAEYLLSYNNIALDKALIIGIRGYYKQSMGDPAKNDRGIFDDAFIIISPTHYSTWNGNTDGGVYRKGMANLVPGIYSYKIGIHGLSKPKEQRYKALVQASSVTVSRDNDITETGWFGINIHSSSMNSVSSLGCQTIYKPQYWDFIAAVESEMEKYKQQTIKYVLVEF